MLPPSGPLHALAEEVAQLEDALRSVGVFVGHRTAHGGRMHADFFGHLLDHHGLQLVDAAFEEILLAGHDGIADLYDGLLALLDVLDQLDGALVALFDVVASVSCRWFRSEQALVSRIKAKLRYVFVIHQDQPLIAVLDESDIGFNQSSRTFVITESRTGIECANVVEGRLHCLDRATSRLGNLFVLLVLHGT